MKLFYLLLFILGLNLSFAQTIDFEDFQIEQDSFLNGSDLSGGFTTDILFLPNTYDQQFDFWSAGWAISNTTDSTTPGFGNQYSSISGNGNEESANYAVSYSSSPSTIDVNVALDEGYFVSGIHINNSTYAYLSMKEGDAFAKKFGGESGDDPDFFLLTIKGYINNNVIADSIDFYLADFRDADNTKDFILRDWTFVDLGVLAFANQLEFTLRSSDVGAFGINTPLYFCMDDVELEFFSSTENTDLKEAINVYPNPTSNFLNIDNTERNLKHKIFDINGRSQTFTRTRDSNKIDISNLLTGTYILETTSANSTYRTIFIKN